MAEKHTSAPKPRKEPAPAYRVFVSSTYTDMIPYRDAIKEAIERSDCMAIGMERFGARAVPPLEICFNQLTECQIYVCAIGMRYGSIDNGTGKSYTQLEFEKAKSLNMPILAFLIDEKNPDVKISIQNIDTDAESILKLKEFKDSIKNSKKITCDFFTSSDDLTIKVQQALQNEISRQEEQRQAEMQAYESRLSSKEQSFEEGALLFAKFLKRPMIYAGQEAVLRVRMDGEYGTWRLKEELLDAFGFEPGYCTFINDLYVLGVQPFVSDSSWVIDCIAEGFAADWLDDELVEQGTIFEGKFRLKAATGVKLVRTTGILIASLELIEGIKVIRKGVHVTKQINAAESTEKVETDNFISESAFDLEPETEKGKSRETTR